MTPEWLNQQELCEHGERRKFCEKCAVTRMPWESEEQMQLRRIGVKNLMLEAQIEEECTKLLEEDGWRSLRTDPVSDRGRGKGFGEVGMADHLFIRYETIRYCPTCGRNCHDYETCGQCHETPERKPWMSGVMWIEFKSAKGKPAKHQLEWHQKERARGAMTLIAGVDFPASVEGFKQFYRNSGLQRRKDW